MIVCDRWCCTYNAENFCTNDDATEETQYCIDFVEASEDEMIDKNICPICGCNLDTYEIGNGALEHFGTPCVEILYEKRCENCGFDTVKA